MTVAFDHTVGLSRVLDDDSDDGDDIGDDGDGADDDDDDTGRSKATVTNDISLRSLKIAKNGLTQ